MAKKENTNNDIKTGTIGLVSVKKSKRLWLCKGIQLFEGSKWNHAFLVVEIAGVLYAYEEGTIWGIIFTPLAEYFEAEKNGECELCFKNIKPLGKIKIETFENAIISRALAYVGRRSYGVFEIPKQAVKQTLQKIGIQTDWNTKRLICSYLVRNILNEVLGVFNYDRTPAPDDLFNDNAFTYFIQR